MRHIFYKVIVSILLLCLSKTLTAQTVSEDILFFELFPKEEQISFEDSTIAAKWSNEYGHNFKHEYLNTKKHNLLFSYVAECFGVPCLGINCFIKNGDRWYLAAYAHTVTDENNTITAHYDENNDKIVFDVASKTLGDINFDFLSNNKVNISDGSPKVLSIIDSVAYIFDICNHIKFKADIDIDSICSSSGNSENNENLSNQLWHYSKKLKKNISIAYFCPVWSSDGSKIVCEQRICRGKKFKKTLLYNIVEIDVGTRVIKILGEGHNPQYCPSSDKYILYRYGSWYRVYDTESNKGIVRFRTNDAKWF